MCQYDKVRNDLFTFSQHQISWTKHIAQAVCTRWCTKRPPVIHHKTSLTGLQSTYIKHAQRWHEELFTVDIIRVLGSWWLKVNILENWCYGIKSFKSDSTNTTGWYIFWHTSSYPRDPELIRFSIFYDIAIGHQVALCCHILCRISIILNPVYTKWNAVPVDQGIISLHFDGLVCLLSSGIFMEHTFTVKCQLGWLDRKWTPGIKRA